MFFAAHLAGTSRQDSDEEKKAEEEEKAAKILDIVYKPQNEREAMQEKTFRKWINQRLEKVDSSPIADVFRDLRDGKKLLCLLESLSGEKLPREKGRTRLHWLNNVNRALQFLHDKNVKLVNVNSNDIVDGNPKITLGLVWSIIQHYWRTYLDQESLNIKQLTLEQALLRWCRQATQGYNNVDIRNFTTCWRDGFAFNAILHRFRPDVIDFDSVSQMPVEERLAQAFKAIEVHFGVKPLLELQDVNSDHIDKKSVLTYVMCLFQSLPSDPNAFFATQASVCDSDVTSTSDDSRRASLASEAKLYMQNVPKILPEELASLASKATGNMLKDYQAAMEDVLTWLLDAEETLQNMNEITDEQDLPLTKLQFKEHEDFMINLTRNQGAIGDVLNQAGGLLTGEQLNEDEKATIKNQMFMLNDKWENIRSGAMKRQTRLQDLLMSQQQGQVDEMLMWLTTMEGIVGRAEAPCPDLDSIRKQIELNKNFESEVAKQQLAVKNLANVILIVDEAAEGADKASAKLEEKLKEVGRRWHLLCERIENRASQLASLEKILNFLTESGRHFSGWLDQREAGLSSLKSAHHLATPKDVLEQVQNLQTMQQDLEAEHSRFVQFCQLSTEAARLLEKENPMGALSVRKSHDDVAQRWENLVCRMQEQSTILIRSGKVDPKKTRLPKISFITSFDSSISQNGGTLFKTSTSSILRKHVEFDVKYGETAEKLRQQSISRVAEQRSKFDSIYAELCRWLDKIESNLALSMQDFTQNELLLSQEHFENDVKTHESLLEALHNAAHVLTEQLRTEGNDVEEIEAKLHDVNGRWRDMCLVLEERKRRMQISNEAEYLNHELQQVEEMVLSLKDWIDNFKSHGISGIPPIKPTDLLECQKKLEIVKQKEPQVELLHNRLARFLESAGEEDDGARNLQKRFDRFTEKWAYVVEKMSRTLENLTTSISKSRGPSVEDALVSLNAWLDSAEDVIATQDLDSLDNMDITETKIQRLKELQNQLIVQRSALDFICSTAEELVAEKAVGAELLSVQLVNLGPRWGDVERVLKSQLSRLESGYSKLTDWYQKAAELDRWIDQVTEFVHAEQPAVGNLETLKEQLAQSQALMADIETLRPKMQEVESSIEELCAQCTPEMKERLIKRMDELDKRWDDVMRLTKAKRDGLSDTYTRSQKTFDDIQQLTSWLTTIEEELNSPADPNSGRELQLLIKRHKQLKDELLSRSDTVEAAVCLGQEMVCSLQSSPEMAQQLQLQLTATRDQWQAICQHVQNKLQLYTDAFEEWKELQELLAAEKISMDELEKQLKESRESAADAEEYSEELDVLERLMEGTGGQEKIESISDSLLAKNILTSAVKSELSKHEARRDQLMEPAKERLKFLEAGVHESQEFEQQLLNCQSWLSHVDYILSTRLNSDILASDVPQEYKQLQSEFDEHEDCIAYLDSQAEAYRKNGKVEAANRLEEQVDHVKKQLIDLKTKFEKFRKPSSTLSILDRLWRVSNDIEQSVTLLRVTSDSITDLDVQLQKSKQIHKALCDMKYEVDDIAGNEQKRPENPAQLTELYARYDELGSKISECERDLQQAASVVQRIKDCLQNTDSYLNVIEHSSQKWESMNKDLLRQEANSIKEIRNKLEKHQLSFNAEIDALSAEWTKLADRECALSMAAKVDETKERMDRMLDSIRKLSMELKESSLQRLTLKQEFGLMLAEVTNFLDSAELTLSELDTQPVGDPSDKNENVLMLLRDDLSKIKPKLNDLRDTAVELMRRSDDHGKTEVEKDLSQINTRWEDVSGKFRLHQQRLRTPSRSPTPGKHLVKIPRLSELPFSMTESLSPVLSPTSALVSVSLDSSGYSKAEASTKTVAKPSESTQKSVRESSTIWGEVGLKPFPASTADTPGFIGPSRIGIRSEPFEIGEEETESAKKPVETGSSGRSDERIAVIPAVAVDQLVSEPFETKPSVREPSGRPESEPSSDRSVTGPFGIKPLERKEPSGPEPEPEPSSYRDVTEPFGIKPLEWKEPSGPEPEPSSYQGVTGLSEMKLSERNEPCGPEPKSTPVFATDSRTDDRLIPPTGQQLHIFGPGRPMPSPRIKRSASSDSRSSVSATVDPKLTDNLNSASSKAQKLLETLADGWSNLEERQQQMDVCETLMNELKDQMEDLKKDGQKLAETGSRELAAQRLLEDIDTLAERQKLLASHLEKQKDMVAQILPSYTAYCKDVDDLRSSLEKSEGKMAECENDAGKIQAAQEELNKQAAEINKCVAKNKNIATKLTNIRAEAAKLLAADFSGSDTVLKAGTVTSEQSQSDPKLTLLQTKLEEAQKRLDIFRTAYNDQQRIKERQAFWDTIKAIENTLTLTESKIEEMRRATRSEYKNFLEQDAVLKTIKENIESVETNVDKLQRRKDSIVPQKTAQEVSIDDEMDPARVESAMSSLRSRLTQLNIAYNDRVKLYEMTLDNWQVFHKNVNSVHTFLDFVDENLPSSQLPENADLQKAESLQKDVEKGFYEKEIELRTAVGVLEELLPATTAEDQVSLKEKLESLNKRFRATAAKIADRREILDRRQSNTVTLRDDIDELLFWLDESEALISTKIDPTNHHLLVDCMEKVKDKIIEFDGKYGKVKDIETLANEFVKGSSVHETIKQGVMMDISELKDRLKKLDTDLQAKCKYVEKILRECDAFWTLFNDVSQWIDVMKPQLEQYQSAIIRTPIRIDIKELEKDMSAKQVDVDQLTQRFAELCAEAKNCGAVVGEKNRFMLRALVDDWSQVLQVFSVIKSSSSSSSSDTDSKTAISDDLTIVPQVSKVDKVRPVEQTVAKRIEATDVSEPPKQEIDVKKPAKDEIIGGSSAEEDEKIKEIVKAEDLSKQLTHLKHWMNDTQVENSGSVDVSDSRAIKNFIRKQQNFHDDLQAKKLQLINITDQTLNSDVQHKAEMLSRDWDRCIEKVVNRKRELMAMLDDSRAWDSAKSDLSLWLNFTQQKIVGKKVSECSIQELYKELSSVEHLMPELDAYKMKITAYNEMSNKLIDSYPHDDSTAISQTTSELNNKWTKLSDSLRVRKAVLEASLRGRNDFHTALEEFCAWLSKINDFVEHLDKDTSNTQLVKDAAYRKGWMDKEKEYRTEIEAHEDILRSLRENGHQLVESLDKTSVDRAKMADRLRQIDERWSQLVERLGGIRNRLSAAQEQWERLTTQLQSLLDWIDEKSQRLLEQKDAGGDLERVRRQKAFCRALRQKIEEKEPQVVETAKLAQSFLLQQDIRSLQGAVSRLPSDDRLTDEQATQRNSLRIALQIKNEADCLAENWPEFLDRVQRWERIVLDSLEKMEQLDRAMKACDADLKEMETRKDRWIPVKDIKLDDLPNQMESAQIYRFDLTSKIRHSVEEVNDCSAQILANSISISPDLLDRIESLNLRYKELEVALEYRLVAVENALREFGPSSQHFLETSVLLPWKRAVSINRIPYYINLDTEKTQWDHPKMVDVMSKLCDFNEVKFSAYRTAMKLRAVQKRLFLDLLNLHDAVALMAQKKLTGLNDKTMDIGDIVMILLPMYENINQAHKDLLKSLPLAIDLCLNWLLNVYDPLRNGVIRVLSFKVALTLMCHATLEEKYKFLFRQVCTPLGGLDQKKLALLIHDCVQIPKYLGEVAAFGGSNIEPSVRSCFEQAKYPQEITIQNFLDWMSREPQSLVWLPVMHRVSMAEMVKHQSKCNICKMFPIVGLRYRCLRCFNFDVCQNCFFSQRTAKSHKITHPMQEYCTASTSGEDMRDFGRIVKNKFRKKRHFRSHPRLGYLPVQSIAEGAPIEIRNVPPFNPLSQELHSNVESLCSRLNELEKSQTFSLSAHSAGDDVGAAASSDADDEHAAIANLSSTLTVDGVAGNGVATLQSPAQLVSQIESAQREEFEALRRRLEDENRRLEMERDRLRAALTPDGMEDLTPNATSTPLTNGSLGRRHTPRSLHPFSSLGRERARADSSHRPDDEGELVDNLDGKVEADDKKLMMEARALREHKEQLEQRSRVLEDHNKQLEVQLKRLKHLIDDQQVNEFNLNLSSEQSTPFTTPASSLKRAFQFQNGHAASDGVIRPFDAEHVTTSNRMGDLMSTAHDLGRAVGNLVNVMASDDEDEVGHQSNDER